MAAIVLTPMQLKRLHALIDGGGGIVDRYGRVVIAGECQPHGAWPAWLNLVAKGLVAGQAGRLLPTEDGLRVASQDRPQEPR